MRRRRSEPSCFFWPAATAFAGAGWQPAVDVYRTRTGWLAKFDLAGVQPEDIHLQVEGPILRVHGVRRDWTLEQGCHHHRLEIAYSQFERHLEFPVSLEQASLSTEYQAGMLLVHIRVEGERP
jgi:HSP20 family protein